MALFRIAISVVLALCSLWAAAALYVDVRIAGLRLPVALSFVVLITLAMFKIRPFLLAIACGFGLFGAVLVWWLLIAPTNDANWLADVAQRPWTETEGEQVTIHNLRNFGYKSELDYLPNWETRRVDLSKLTGVDLFVNFWGSPHIAHLILSFQFENAPAVAFSIETRKTVGQEYSAVLGFFRQFALIYVVGDERDLVRVRTNYRKGEDLYLYHMNLSPRVSRSLFLSYLKPLNELQKSPVWYNALTHNCTTSIVPMLAAASGESVPLDWRMLLSGHMDEMLYERKQLAGDLPFAELKGRAHINEAARAANDSPEFSRLIRVNRPGFK